MNSRCSKLMNLLLIAVLISLTATSCTSTGRSKAPNSLLLANQNNQPEQGTGTVIDRLGAYFGGRSGDRRRPGTDDFLAPAGSTKNSPVIVSDDGSFSLNLIRAPIEQAAKAVLGDALNKSYTIQSGVTAEITLQTTRPLTERELLETFSVILQINGVAMKSSGDLITLVPQNGGPQRFARIGDAAGFGSRIVAVPLEYIGTKEMIRLLNPIVAGTLNLQEIPNRNILLVSGTQDEIEAAVDAVNLFDVDVLKGKSVGLYKLTTAEPETVAEELSLIFETQDGGGLENVVSFIPSKRLSSILVITSRSRYLSEAESWIRELDRTAGGATRRPVVYSLQNRGATELEPILTKMVEDVASEEESSGIGGLKIVADDANNALIVWGDEKEQQALARLIQTLDVTPVQVLLEATIAEVSLNDELSFGLRWFFENGQLKGTFTDVASGAVASNFPGLSFLFQGRSAAAALNALSSVTEVRVISSPSLLVLDNREARLQIGDEVPVATQQVRDTTDPSAPVVNTISFRDTGIILKVKPRVSASGQVVMDINQEVSSVSTTTTSGIDSPTISQRRIETSIVVSNGQTLALGGLIQDNKNRTDGKVPGLGDVPVLGTLFRNRSTKFDRTELLILITPKVIKTAVGSREITQELRSRISGANGVIAYGIDKPSTRHRIFSQ